MQGPSRLLKLDPQRPQEPRDQGRDTTAADLPATGNVAALPPPAPAPPAPGSPQSAAEAPPGTRRGS